jgi:hypothetical protein
MSEPAPYTGRIGAEPRPPGQADPAIARISWGRMTLVHLGAGFLVAFALPLILMVTEGDIDFGWFVAPALIVALLIAAVGGGVPLVLARVAHLIVVMPGRGLVREVAAVAGGALLGAVVVAGILYAVTTSAWSLWTILVIGLPSAIGFAIWVLVAWRPRRVDAGAPEHSLN